MSTRPFALLLLLWVSVAAAKPDGTSTMPAKRLPDFDAGKRLWKQSCWQCHGEVGKGDGPSAAALVGGVPSLEGKVKGEDFDALIAVIQDGRGKMPAYSEDIDQHDSRRILGYIRDVMSGKKPPPPEKDEGDDAEAAEGQ
jgi:mono/diheme cytochrome c family protein